MKRGRTRRESRSDGGGAEERQRRGDGTSHRKANADIRSPRIRFRIKRRRIGDEWPGIADNRRRFGRSLGIRAPLRLPVVAMEPRLLWLLELLLFLLFERVIQWRSVIQRQIFAPPVFSVAIKRSPLFPIQFVFGFVSNGLGEISAFISG